MSIRQQPHYRLQSRALAEWLDRQDANSWWSIDGDRELMERVHFPCPGDELAEALRRINRPLLLLAPEGGPEADGRDIGANQLDALAESDADHDRAFQLCWESDSPEIDWILSEDLEVGETSSSSSGS